MTTSSISACVSFSPSSKPELTFPEAVLEFLKTTQGVRKLVLEFFSTCVDWITLFRPFPKFSKLSTTAAHAKNWISWAQVPEETVLLAKQTGVFLEKKNKSECGKLANRSACLLISATDIGSTLHHYRICFKSPLALKIMGLVGAGAIATAGVHDFVENKHVDLRVTSKEMIACIGAISDIAYGAITVLSGIFSFSVPLWIPLALSTQSLFSTLIGQFYPYLNIN